MIAEFLKIASYLTGYTTLLFIDREMKPELHLARTDRRNLPSGSKQHFILTL